MSILNLPKGILFYFRLRHFGQYIWDLFVCVDTLWASQQISSHIGTVFLCLSRLNQYLAEDKVSCARTQHSASGESRTSDPSFQSLY